MVDRNPRGQPILLEDPYTFNDLVFDTIVARLGYINTFDLWFHLKEKFNLRREGNDVRLLQKRINLQLVCPLCANIQNTEEGVAKMFYKA